MCQLFRIIAVFPTPMREQLHGQMHVHAGWSLGYSFSSVSRSACRTWDRQPPPISLCAMT